MAIPRGPREIQRLLHQLRCALPIVRDRPVRIPRGPLKDFRWLPRSGEFACSAGTYEEATQHLFLAHIKRGEVVYDLGAHRGYFSLLASRIVGEEGKVFAFEPLPENVRFIVAHAELNGCENIFPRPYAITRRAGSVTITNLADHLANTTRVESPRFSPQAPKLQVEARALDELVGRGLPPPQFMKIDIEGSEYDALVGAREILERNRPLLYVSVHENHLKGVEKQCLELLSETGYCLTLVDTNELTHGIRDYFAVPSKGSDRAHDPAPPLHG